MPERPLHVFVDYDGTITNVDTFDVLVQAFAGDERWASLEACLHGGEMTLREVLSAQAAFVTCSLDEADALLAQRVAFDPTFAEFIARCRDADVPLVVLSSGVAPLIERAFERNGLRGITVLANTVEPRPEGWIMRFRDGSENGHDKAAAVRAARHGGAQVVFVGDGHSDFAAALVADVRFAKHGRALERYLRTNGVEFTPFASFDEVQARLFAPSGVR